MINVHEINQSILKKLIRGIFNKFGFEIAIIPKTLELTNLIYLKEKDLVNVEFDVLGKYIKSFIK